MVRLDDIVEALDFPEEWESYLDPESGKVITITEEERAYLEDEDLDLESLPDWERESVTAARRAMESKNLLPLPDRFDVHEWEIMRRFSGAQEEDAAQELLDAIHGRGAFRMFKATIDRLGLREAWYAYRAAALKRIARDWLEAEGIPYVEGHAAPE